VIASLHGTLLHRGSDALIVDVNGVGYLVTVGGRTSAQLGQTGQAVRLYTYTYVREDTLALYGFTSPEELAFFKLLLSVKGIGPKAALAILNRAELKVISRAILSEDAALLSTIPGIGPKTAARVVLELKGKLKEEMFVGEPAPGIAGDAVAQALAVLTGLGYTPGEAREAVRRAAAGNGGGRSVEELVTVALRGLDRHD
jgi:Holliday junction DNA helicase RuvA